MRVKMPLCRVLVAGLILILLHCAAAAFYQGNGDIQNEYVRTGNNATVFCQPAADIENINRIVWYKEDRKIIEYINGRRSYWDAGPHVSLLPHNNALYFRRVTYQDSGEYYCEVNNKRTRSSLARLLVQDIPDPGGMPLIMGFTSRSVNLSWAPSTDNHNSPILHYIINVSNLFILQSTDKLKPLQRFRKHNVLNFN
ncbi:neural cell adhesion molecule L1.1-like [Uloborus diversus]|uniref:neural cell adhesion molecule L1.1-like n=1 Tax=Uloborus diversus TaxID=327109 RepID=UPI00240914ED|nr:neural cell adhesion molecule L1.1-like [Uloborus diversus]